MPPDGGDVTVLGRSWDDDPREIQERIGVQLQETDFQDKLKVFELLGDDPRVGQYRRRMTSLLY